MSENNSLTVYIKSDPIVKRFSDVLGDKNAQPYIQSVLIAVSSSKDLMECSNDSIVRSALRAASLGLSCDPALKQAWIVPYNKKIKTTQGDKWVKEAQFQPHYRGLYTLAMRTGKYWQINVSPVYEGQRVLENSLTGLHMVQEENGLIGKPQGANAAYMDVTIRRKKNLKVIGWLGYFKTKKGFEKSVWMSAVEIADHAEKYVKDYAKNPNWNDLDKRPVMEMKTVLRQLLSWADLSGNENVQLVEALAAEESPEIVDAVDEPVAEEEKAEQIPTTYEEAAKVIILNMEGHERTMDELGSDILMKLIESEKYTDSQKEAARIVLKHDFQMEAPSN